MLLQACVFFLIFFFICVSLALEKVRAASHTDIAGQARGIFLYIQM